MRKRKSETVGEFLEEVKAKASARPKTIEGYCRAFRTIVADIFKIDGGKSKYDYRNDGRAAWLAKINNVKIADVTPDEVQKWKLRFLRRVGSDPVQTAGRSHFGELVNAPAKSLFAPAILKFVSLELPSALPFTDVGFEKRQSMRYRSGFDIEELIGTAQKELPPEQLKILLLAVMAGLRRNEIDKLEWPAFRWNEGVIRIEATRYFHPKSEDSLGDVEVDPELLAIFRGFHTRANKSFVIKSPVAPRPDAMYSHYRCQRHFEGLTAWLRAKGVKSNMPLHTLRKEFGSQICGGYGIYAASRALRHADIAITSQHYLEPRRRATVGLGNLLAVADNIVPIADNRDLKAEPTVTLRSAEKMKDTMGSASSVRPVEILGLAGLPGLDVSLHYPRRHTRGKPFTIFANYDLLLLSSQAMKPRC